MPVRANRVGEILRRMFNLAIRWGIRTDDPAESRCRDGAENAEGIRPGKRLLKRRR